MKTGIYMIRNKVNDKKYIGQAVDIDFRWATHISELNNNKHINRYLQRAWNKYGEDNFEFTIICLCEEDELDDFEIDMIAYYHTFYKDGDGGYNLTLGGGGSRGYKHTDEERAKMSEARKGKPLSEEHKAKISESLKEAMNRPEVRKKKSEAMKEALNRPEVKKKHREAIKEAYNRPEVRKKRSEIMKEYCKDPEVKKKKSEAKKGKGVKAVYCASNDTIYESLVEAGEKLGVDLSRISRCCNGKCITRRYPDGHHYSRRYGSVYEFWFLDEYEEKFGKVAL